MTQAEAQGQAAWSMGVEDGRSAGMLGEAFVPVLDGHEVLEVAMLAGRTGREGDAEVADLAGAYRDGFAVGLGVTVEVAA